MSGSALRAILRTASRHYPDGGLEPYFDASGHLRPEGRGDSLARFVVAELGEVYDLAASKEENAREAVRALETGVKDLEAGIGGLRAAYGLRHPGED